MVCAIRVTLSISSVFGTNGIHMVNKLWVYRKIPNISTGLIEVRMLFLEGLYSGGLIFKGAYIRDFTVLIDFVTLF